MEEQETDWRGCFVVLNYREPELTGSMGVELTEEQLETLKAVYVKVVRVDGGRLRKRDRVGN